MKKLVALLALCMLAGVADAKSIAKGARLGPYSITVTWLDLPNLKADGSGAATALYQTIGCSTTRGGPYTTRTLAVGAAALTGVVTGITAGTWYCVVYGTTAEGNTDPTPESIGVVKP